MAVRRPIGVAILAILDWFGGALLVVIGLIVAAALSSVEGEGWAGLGATIGVIYCVLGFMAIVMGFGLWSLKTWAWWLQVVGVGLGVFGSLLALSGDSPGDALLGLLISGAVLIYFLSTPIRAAFGVTGQSPAGTVMR